MRKCLVDLSQYQQWVAQKVLFSNEGPLRMRLHQNKGPVELRAPGECPKQALGDSTCPGLRCQLQCPQGRGPACLLPGCQWGGQWPHPWRGVGSRATGERRSSGRALSRGGRPSLFTPVFTFLAKKITEKPHSWALKNTGEFVMPDEDCQACSHAVAKQTALLSQETL